MSPPHVSMESFSRGVPNPINFDLEYVVDVQSLWQRFLLELESPSKINNQLKANANNLLLAVQRLHKAVMRLPPQGRVIKLEGSAAIKASAMIQMMEARSLGLVREGKKERPWEERKKKL